MSIICGRLLVVPVGLAVAFALLAAPAEARRAQSLDTPSAMALVASDSSAARNSTRHLARNFTRSRVKYIPRLDRCVKLVVKGRVSGTRSYDFRLNTRWRDVKVRHPRITASTYNYYPGPPGPDCGGRRSVKKFKLSQVWKHAGCNVGITGVSGSFPWGIGASFGCTGGDDATRRTSTDGAGRFAEQSNPGTIIKFKGVTYSWHKSFKVRVKVSARIHRKMNGGSRNSQVSTTFLVKLPGQ